jgi:anti-sigma regulatory factor (Ser/Thr protein kinase)
MVRQLSLAAKPSELSKAREFADSAARAFYIDDDDRHAFKFAASEAVANAIEHGSPSRDGEIELRLVAEGDTLTLYVRDYGTFAPASSEPQELPERGRGLAFMVLLMDEVEVKTVSDGTVTRLAKRRRSGSSAYRRRPPAAEPLFDTAAADRADAAVVASFLATLRNPKRVVYEAR